MSSQIFILLYPSEKVTCSELFADDGSGRGAVLIRFFEEAVDGFVEALVGLAGGGVQAFDVSAGAGNFAAVLDEGFDLGFEGGEAVGLCFCFLGDEPVEAFVDVRKGLFICEFDVAATADGKVCQGKGIEGGGMFGSVFTDEFQAEVFGTGLEQPCIRQIDVMVQGDGTELCGSAADEDFEGFGTFPVRVLVKVAVEGLFIHGDSF